MNCAYLIVINFILPKTVSGRAEFMMVIPRSITFLGVSSQMWSVEHQWFLVTLKSVYSVVSKAESLWDKE